MPQSNSLQSFIPIDANSDFSLNNLPFGVFTPQGHTDARVGVALGDQIIDLAVLAEAGLLALDASIFRTSSLQAFLGQSKKTWRAIRQQLQTLLTKDNPTLRDNSALRSRVFHAQKTAIMHLPVQPMGYTDFYSSLEHATNLGKLFRPNQDPLTPNWRHMPIAYDGRASALVVSGTSFHRPWGQLKRDDAALPILGPSQRLDTEVEVAFIIGTPNVLGQPISVQDAADHVFGMVLLSDWSARDIQKWEYVPLGPFLGKNFCTSISPWVVMLEALAPFRVTAREQEPAVLPYLQSQRDHCYDIRLSLAMQTPGQTTETVISQMNYRDVYWDVCQQLAHHTINGCPMNSGDIIASGTISGAEPATFGSLVELTWGGTQPITLANGEQRCFIEDHDSVIIRGYCQGENYRVGFGEVRGKVLPAVKFAS